MNMRDAICVRTQISPVPTAEVLRFMIIFYSVIVIYPREKLDFFKA